MGASTSSTDLREDDSSFYSPVCCFRSKPYEEEVVAHLSWQRSSIRDSSQGKPGPPEGIVKVDETTHNTAVLSWLSPLFRGMGPILAYHVERYTPKDKKWETVTETCQGTSYKVRDLLPGTKYVFRVRAENIHGVSRPSLESDPVVLPLLGSADGVTSDATTTFTRRGSNFLDSDSGVKTIVKRSLNGEDHLERWSFPRQQKRRRSALDSLLKRPCSTGPRRLSYSPGFRDSIRDSIRIVKNNPLFSDSFENSPLASPSKDVPLVSNLQEENDSSTTQLLQAPQLVLEEENVVVPDKELNADGDELEMALIITKDIMQTLSSFTKTESEATGSSKSLTNSVADQGNVEAPLRGTSSHVKSKTPSGKKCIRSSVSAEALSRRSGEMFEFDLDDTGVKVPMKKSSSSTDVRFNIRKPLHPKLFIPPGEDSLEEYDVDETGEKIRMSKLDLPPPSDDEIQEVVNSLTSLYHSQMSLSENKAEALPDQEEITLPESVQKTSKLKAEPDSEPVSSEYDGSASDSDEMRSTIPPVLSVFIESDSSCDDDPTDTSASSHKDGLTTDTEREAGLDSDSDLSLTDYFGDESDDSADIDSFKEKVEKPSSKPVDSSDDETVKTRPVQHEVTVDVHELKASHKVKHKSHHRVQVCRENESDSAASRENSIRTPRISKHKSSSNHKLDVKPGSSMEQGISETKMVDAKPVFTLDSTEVDESVSETKATSLPNSSLSSTKNVKANRSSIGSLEVTEGAISLPVCSTPNSANLKANRSSSDSVEDFNLNKKRDHIKAQGKRFSGSLAEISTPGMPSGEVGSSAGKTKDVCRPEGQNLPSPLGSDEGVDMDTQSDTEVIIIHNSTEVINRLQELMSKDPKLAQMLTTDARFQQALNTNQVAKEKASRETKPKVTFADAKQNKL